MHPELKKLAMIGCGAMGGGMALLFAENGLDVLLKDPSNEAMDKVLQSAKSDGVNKKISKYQDYKTLCQSFESTKVFVWSLPHGHVGDDVLEQLMPFLEMGDIIIDAANEHWENSERRIGKCHTKGIRYVAMGVSGGYQAARRGPSMCPSTDVETFDIVLPLLEKVAARAPDGTPCVARIGTGSAGHYCKMIHNGIEHGMMSAVAEAWGIMTKGLGMDNDQIAQEFHRWNTRGELQGTFLVRIAAEICATFDAKGERVLDQVGDKVVQDFTGEEGTGIWSNTEAVMQHVPAPTLGAAHFLRLAAGNLHERRKAEKNFAGSTWSVKKMESVESKETYLEALRLTVYATCLASYVQGMNIIEKADKQYKFHVNYLNLLQIWRSGCIIQADAMSSNVLMPIYKNFKTKSEKNPLFEPIVAKEFKKCMSHDEKGGSEGMKGTILAALKADQHVPAMSAALEWIKYQTSTDLPTSMYEAQLDYFGKHMYDRKGIEEDKEGLPTMGKYHYEWKKA